MRRGQNRTTKTTLRSERSSALKKDLTGPTLLEMSANPAYRQSWATFGQNHSTKIRRTNVNRFGPVLLENIAMKVALADLL